MNFGVLLPEALRAAEQLDATVIDMRWVKPLDRTAILDAAAGHARLITVEENSIAGGAGSGVAELLAAEGIDIPVRHIGISDAFIDHASQQQNRVAAGLTAEDIINIASDNAGYLTAQASLTTAMIAPQRAGSLQRVDVRIDDKNRSKMEP